MELDCSAPDYDGNSESEVDETDDESDDGHVPRYFLRMDIRSRAVFDRKPTTQSTPSAKPKASSSSAAPGPSARPSDRHSNGHSNRVPTPASHGSNRLPTQRATPLKGPRSLRQPPHSPLTRAIRSPSSGSQPSANPDNHPHRPTLSSTSSPRGTQCIPPPSRFIPPCIPSSSARPATPSIPDSNALPLKSGTRRGRLQQQSNAEAKSTTGNGMRPIKKGVFKRQMSSPLTPLWKRLASKEDTKHSNLRGFRRLWNPCESKQEMREYPSIARHADYPTHARLSQTPHHCRPFP